MGEALGLDDVLLCQGDSTSALGWVDRSSFGDKCPLHLGIARSLSAYLSMDNDIAHYAQWFPGKENSVADMLSRDFTLSDGELVLLVHLQFSNHVPQSFCILPLSTTMLTSVGRLLRLLPKTQQ